VFVVCSSAVYSFARAPNQSQWTLISNLMGSGTPGAFFGWSVAISADGSTLAVGETGANAVWIYAASPVSSGAWDFRRTLFNTDFGFSAVSMSFGSSCALSASGDTLAVGVAGFSGNKGAAMVFVRDSGSGVWNAQSGILNNGSSGGTFGVAIAINEAGTRIAVGAYTDSAQGPDSGAVYIYARDASLNWIYLQQVVPSDFVSVTSRWFGHSVSLSSSGHTLVVGAPGEGATGMVTGAWWHFEWNGTLFEQSGLKKVGQPTSNNARQGWSIALSADGNTVLGSCIAACRMPAYGCYFACLLTSSVVLRCVVCSVCFSGQPWYGQCVSVYAQRVRVH